MEASVSDIVRDVRICFDENQSGLTISGISDPDTLLLDEIIASKIEEAVDMVHMAAPYHILLENGKALQDQPVGISFDNEETCGYVKLPRDFMRLVMFQMSDWLYPVYNTLSAESPEYAKQKSPIKALRGSYDRPVCAIAARGAHKVLEFYSCKTNTATVTQCLYIPYCKIIDNGGQAFVSNNCYKSMVYACAALTASTCGDKERAEMFFNLSKTSLQK